MKTIGRYSTSFQANLIKGLLESEGIVASVLNENVNYILPPVDNRVSIEVVVADDDYEEAMKIISDPVLDDPSLIGPSN